MATVMRLTNVLQSSATLGKVAGGTGSRSQSSDGDEAGTVATTDTILSSIFQKGPVVSIGSAQHPNGCEPCVYYCFSKRGCNKGDNCDKCHDLHESKLRKKRESWKKDARTLYRARAAKKTQEVPLEKTTAGLAQIQADQENVAQNQIDSACSPALQTSTENYIQLPVPGVPAYISPAPGLSLVQQSNSERYISPAAPWPAMSEQFGLSPRSVYPSNDVAPLPTSVPKGIDTMPAFHNSSTTAGLIHGHQLLFHGLPDRRVLFIFAR